jgi:Putative peptidoglycan binding domain
MMAGTPFQVMACMNWSSCAFGIRKTVAILLPDLAGPAAKTPSKNEGKEVNRGTRMTKFIALLIGLSLALASGVHAKQAEQENSKSKKSKPNQQQQPAPKQQVAPKQQLAPKQHTAPNPQAQAMPKQSKNPTLQDNARIHQDNGPKQQLNTPAVQSNNARKVTPNKFTVQPNQPVVQPNTLPAVQSNKFKVNKTVNTFQPKHQNFHAQVNSSVASVQFNKNFRIRNAENWKGAHYNVFRTYRPQWHDRGWWHSRHNHIILIGGGWYYWNAGYWYPAWGYDDSAAYYPYDGPIYVGSSPRPFDQVVADVQSVLQEQGYYRGEVDGLVGPLTQEALAAYQSAEGLAPTAAIDQPTLESLGIS